MQVVQVPEFDLAPVTCTYPQYSRAQTGSLKSSTRSQLVVQMLSNNMLLGAEIIWMTLTNLKHNLLFSGRVGEGK